jgi:hypothetical protein
MLTPTLNVIISYQYAEQTSSTEGDNSSALRLIQLWFITILWYIAMFFQSTKSM